MRHVQTTNVPRHPRASIRVAERTALRPHRRCNLAQQQRLHAIRYSCAHNCTAASRAALVTLNTPAPRRAAAYVEVARSSPTKHHRPASRSLTTARRSLGWYECLSGKLKNVSCLHRTSWHAPPLQQPHSRVFQYVKAYAAKSYILERPSQSGTGRCSQSG